MKILKPLYHQLSHVTCQMLNVKCQNGQMVIVALVILTFVLILVGTLFGRTAQFLRFGGNNLRQEQAINLAEAGVDYAIWQLNENAGVFAPPTQNVILSTGEVDVTVETVDTTNKTITSTGYFPQKANYRSKNTIKLNSNVNTTQVEFHYGIQTGSGGVVDLTGGSVVNGNVWAGCPSPCDPITNIVGSGNSNINGQARATGTISAAPGLSVNPEPNNRFPNRPQSEAPALPVVDYQVWKDEAGTAVCDADDGVISGTQNLGPCRQTGNLTIQSGAVVTVTGTIYVTGNLTITSNNTRFKLSDTYGSYEAVVLSDGIITVAGGGVVEANNANPKGYILLATTCPDTTCNPDSMIISGGTQTGIFYVLLGRANLSGSVHLTGLVAKTAIMTGGATLDYDTGLANSSFTSGPGGSWQVAKGSYRFSP